MCYKHNYTFAAHSDQLRDALGLCLSMTSFCCHQPFPSSFLNVSLVDLMQLLAAVKHILSRDQITELFGCRQKTDVYNTTPSHGHAALHRTDIILYMTSVIKKY